MLTRDIRRLALILVPVLVFFYATYSIYHHPSYIPSRVNDWIGADKTSASSNPDHVQVPAIVGSEQNDGGSTPPNVYSPATGNTPPTDANAGHNYNDNDPGQYQDSSAFEDIEGSPLPDNHPAIPGNHHYGAGGSSDAANTPTAALPVASTAVVSPGSPPNASQWQEILSVSTADKKYFLIDFGGSVEAINPNILPHPTQPDTWIVVAQEDKDDYDTEHFVLFVELSCTAVFGDDGRLKCLHDAQALPVKNTEGGKCEGDLTYFNFSQGPHDARAFWGPEKPYIMFGSNSGHTCFGLFLQDFRSLVGGGITGGGIDMTVDSPSTPSDDQYFREGTEIKRPLPWGVVEKNWFIFWDPEGKMYVHYDIVPRRVFAEIHGDASIGPDLAPKAEAQDAKCLAKYIPPTAPENESVHQATNSLRVTNCKRSDPTCVPGPDNTFIVAIYQFKSFHRWHGVYEPYLMAFRENAPFELYGMSKKPFWLHGRNDRPDEFTSDMMYVTSISWKKQGLRYHGYADDVIFIGFGVEDEQSAVMDVYAGTLFENLGLCDEL